MINHHHSRIIFINRDPFVSRRELFTHKTTRRQSRDKIHMLTRKYARHDINDNRNRNDVQRWPRARARRTRCIEKPLCDVRPRCARPSVACRAWVSIFVSREIARVLTGRWPITFVSCRRHRLRSRTVVHAIHACVISRTARARGHRSPLVARADISPMRRADDA